jgi:hypothetical protein
MPVGSAEVQPQDPRQLIMRQLAGQTLTPQEDIIVRALQRPAIEDILAARSKPRGPQGLMEIFRAGGQELESMLQGIRRRMEIK